MKATTCLLIGLFMSLSSLAQTEKGRWTAGFSIGSFDYQTSQTGYTFAGSINPSAGYFIGNNLLVGLSVPVSYSTSKYTNLSLNATNKETSTQIGGSPYVRYYFGAKAFKPYVGVAYSYALSSSRRDYAFLTPPVSTSKWATMQLTPYIGLAYFLNRTISLDAQLGYNWNTTWQIQDSSSVPGSTDAYTYKNASLSIGFSVFFGK